MPKYTPTNDDLMLDYRIDVNHCQFCSRAIPAFDAFCDKRCEMAQQEYDDFMAHEMYDWDQEPWNQ